eukprot:SAG11_NODE_41644_length_191_cov_33.184783_2_plen_39_part_01
MTMQILKKKHLEESKESSSDSDSESESDDEQEVFRQSEG